MNPRREGKEHVKAITLRSGRELVTPGPPPIVLEIETEEVDDESKNHLFLSPIFMYF